MASSAESRTDEQWIELFREGGPKRAPKEPGLSAGSAKPDHDDGYRRWRASGAPTGGRGRPVFREGFYHLQFKVHSRGGGAAGRTGGSVMAGIAYRTAERLEKVRAPEDPSPDRDGPDSPDALAAGPAAAHAAYQTGAIVDIYDFSRKRGVADWYTLIPEGAPAWMAEPERLGEVWAAVAAREDRSTRRTTATEAREAVLGLPAEVDPETRAALAHDFARHLVERYGVIATVALHEPSGGGDQRNQHAHIMISDRRCEPEGFTDKVRELNLANGGREEARYLRALWASMLNEAYGRAALGIRVDHRSYRVREEEARARGDTIEADRWAREATEHMGRALTRMERASLLDAARQARREARPGGMASDPVTELGRENRRRRAASVARESEYQEQVRDRGLERDRGRERSLPGENVGF